VSATRFLVALAAALLGATTGARAQVSCAGLTSLACTQANQQFLLVQSFQSLPLTAAGMAVFRADIAAVENIYLNASAAQRNQAATNFDLHGLHPQENIWDMLKSSNALYPSLLTFPQLPVSAALADQVHSEIKAATPAAVMDTITTMQKAAVDQVQAGALKDSFTAYATAFAGQSTIYANPGQIDPRPFQISQAIAGNPWSSITQAGLAGTSIASQTEQWGNGPNGLQTSGSFPSEHSVQGNTTGLLYALLLPQAYQSLMVSAQQFALSRNILGAHHTLDVIGSRVLAYYAMTQSLAGNPDYSTAVSLPAIQQVSQQLAALVGPTLAAVPYASCAGAAAVATCLGNGTFPAAATFANAARTYAQQATYGLPPVGPTNLAAVVPTNADLLIATRFPYLSRQQRIDVLASTELPSGGPFDDGSGWVRLNLYAAAGGYGALTAPTTVTMDATQGGFNAIDVWSNDISGPGGLTLLGSGTLVLAGNNTYTGGTTVGCAAGIGCATLALSGTLTGNLTVMAGATFVTAGGYVVNPGAIMTNGGTVQSVNTALVNLGTLLNTGSLQGAVVNGGQLTNNGTITGNVTNTGGVSGTGTIVGNLSSSSYVAPGNPLGTLTVTGTYTQTAAGTFIAQVGGSGQGNLLSVGGAASVAGALQLGVQQTTALAARSTYRIIGATGGLSGRFGSITNNYPFLQPSLSYDANNAYLALQVGGFAAAAGTPTQAAVGAVLDANVNTASGDFAQVLSALATGVQGPAAAQYALQSISGNNYAGFASSLVLGAQSLMNNFAGQAGGGAPAGTRVALAEACEVACDTTAPARWGAWGGGVGSLGSLGSGAAAGAVTYNSGGFAAGLDRQVTETLRLGITAGTSAGTQWVSGFAGQGRTDTFNAGLYANHASGPAYLDALAGYAYSNNQMWRTIALTGLPMRTAYGQAGANQWYGQLEGGWRFDLAAAWLTPFARLQAYTGTLGAFTETGAQSLNLSVAAQTTNSLRSVLGAQLGGSIDLGWRDRLALQLRLGWSHEYADVGRPVTATLAGAAAMPFTTFGISPTRDGALLGLAASTALADTSSIYFRYEGIVSGQDNAHAFTAGLRMTW